MESDESTQDVTVTKNNPNLQVATGKKMSPYGVPDEINSNDSSPHYSTPGKDDGDDSSPDPFKFTTSQKVLSISGLVSTTTDNEIKGFFAGHNLSIMKVQLNKDEANPGQQQGYVQFEKPGDADYALNVLNGAEYDEKKNKMRLKYSKLNKLR